MTQNYSAKENPISRRLSGKVILVTGAGTGVGQAAALIFARAGAAVVGCGRRESALQETRNLAELEGLENIDLESADITDPANVQKWINNVVQRHGGIDGLFNNAASAQMAAIADMTPTQWHDTLRGELDTVFFPTQAAWPHLIRRGSGSIVNVSSLSGMRGVEDLGAVAHAAAKGGVIGMTRQIALEGAPHWIRCNAISPGPISSPGIDPYLRDNPNFRRRVEGWPLLARIGQGQDVAYAALFLLSDEASWITGINLPVDGGWSSKGGHTQH